MSSELNQTGFARVTVDALTGAGFVLREGDVIERKLLGEHLEPLLSSGAIVLCDRDEFPSNQILAGMR